MNVLELFSGTRSVGKVCDQLDWKSVSVDMILPATHQCDVTFGGLVCGDTLCDECEHTIDQNGVAYGHLSPKEEWLPSHCKKTEQKYKVWWEREKEKLEREKKQ